MAWTSPMTAVANSVFTAAQFNTHVRDNLNETAPAKATTASGFFVATGPNAIVERIPQSDFEGTSETTASTSYGDLATVGPSVSLSTGPFALVILSTYVANNTSGQTSYMSFEISGATALGANDVRALRYESGSANDEIMVSWVDFRTSLTPGTNVFTARYKVSGGTGTFANREITVIPF